MDCPICDAASYRPFFERRDVPTQDGRVWRTRHEALTAPTSGIRLALCHACGYVGNEWFDPLAIRYDDDYAFSMFQSQVFREFLTHLAGDLIERLDLRGRTILEIACGDGAFLELLCGLGHNDGLGVDPTASPGSYVRNGNVVEFVQELYAEQHLSRTVDFICCRQALDQVAEPRAFAALVHRHAAPASAPVYFEVPNAECIFQEAIIRNVVAEKRSWFTAASLSKLCVTTGFSIDAIGPCFVDGQYLNVVATPARSHAPVPDDSVGPTPEFLQAVGTFSARYDATVESWRTQLSHFTTAGRKLMAWGAGAGAINFLTSLRIRDEVPLVVDINPERQGRFLPLTGQEIVDPSAVRTYAPDVMIVTNATYEREIALALRELGPDCELWTL
ncbi:MAG: class I SAM-dependent methyltransferase [Vicinamibacterales bacterium]